METSSLPPTERLQIRVTESQDGFVFRLHPLSRQKVEAERRRKTQDASPLPKRIFIAYPPGDSSTPPFSSQTASIVSLLTGLTTGQIQGVFQQVVFINTADESPLFSWDRSQEPRRSLKDFAGLLEGAETEEGWEPILRARKGL